MATAKKLPSGSWRVRVFAGYEIKDGKKKPRYESFTAETKRQAELMAAEWSAKQTARPEDITVGDAVDRYIQSREAVLSPSTVKGYLVCRSRITQIEDIRLRDLKTDAVQVWISDLAGDLSPKTVSNTYAILTAALEYVSFDGQLRVKLPAKQKPLYHLPTDEDIQTLLQYAALKTDKSLWIAIMLGRYYGLRRGEICALNSSDLHGDVLYIHRSMVIDKDKNWIIKDTPKTYASNRSLTLTEPLLSTLKSIDGNFLTCNPDALGNQFNRAVKACKIEPFNFHMLRHLFATKAAMLGIPDIYTAQMGGWRSNSPILKTVYQNVRDEDFQKHMKTINENICHEM